jgi:multidrug resistance efflux pump
VVVARPALRNDRRCLFDARQFAISSKVAGYISKVAVTDNEQVEEGQLLIQIDDRDYKIALQQAEAQLEQAQAAVRNADAQIEAQQARRRLFRTNCARRKRR